ncbi:MAG TPA: hypothetical protein ENK57_09340 [Polyangiaceae bacterium]|nr:hypothetical protein [Polyangiaceae bacterium]
MQTTARYSLNLALGFGLLFACDGTPTETDAGLDQDAAAETDAGPMVDCSGRPAEAPVTRSEVGMVYDAPRDRLVIYGGNTAASERCAVPDAVVVDEMWAFHFDCNNWERLNPSGGPGQLRRQATVLDESRGRMLMFGGRGPGSPFGSYVDEVWAFDLATDSWSEITTTGDTPPGLGEAIAQLDTARDRLLVFGGNPGGFSGSDGMYALDLNTNVWTEITAAGAPTPRLYHASTVVGNELIVFGGTGGFNPPYFNDTYAFDMSADTWRVVTTDAPPRARFGMELVADPDRGRVIMAFGHDATNLGNSNDVWALDLAAGSWTELHPGDTPNAPAAGMCDFPPDFTIIEDGTPERRYSVGLAAAGDHAYFFGGKADCGYLNDVWSMDLATGAWTSVRTSTGGEVCLRTGRTDCSGLCG